MKLLSGRFGIIQNTKDSEAKTKKTGKPFLCVVKILKGDAPICLCSLKTGSSSSIEVELKRGDFTDRHPPALNIYS